MSFSYMGKTYRNFEEFERDFKKPVGHVTVAPLVTHTSSQPKMNKIETEYGRMLVAQHGKENVWFNSIKLKVGEDTCWYTPDFAVRLDHDVLEFHEVKGGHIWEDSVIKFKAAKLQYPMFRFIWAQKLKGQWHAQV